MSIVKDMSLQDKGLKKINWVRSFIPLISVIEERFVKEQPIKDPGRRVGASGGQDRKPAFVLAKAARRYTLQAQIPCPSGRRGCGRG
jgi:S-adenosylhomocysteine hydrolase